MSSIFYDAVLALEKGAIFYGKGFGKEVSSGGEAIFNTGLSGYQEVFTDPSYSHQMVVMTYPHIGNTGINREDVESGKIYLKGIVVREYCEQPSNWRSKISLHEYLSEAGVTAISDVDTREITKILRDQGAQRSVIFSVKDAKGNVEAHAKKLLETVPDMEGLDLVSLVSCKKPYVFQEGAQKHSPLIVVYDFGVKTNILRLAGQNGCKVWVVPYDMPYEEVAKENPAAVLLANGPGDPAKVPGTVKEIQKMIGKTPILAICMGHQLLARAIGGETYKLKFGHHGSNQPVQDLETGRIMITSQNHGFCVKEESIKDKDVRVSHINLNDKTVEGLTSKKLGFYSVSSFIPKPNRDPAMLLSFLISS